MSTYKIFANAMISSPGKYHICRESGDLIESEELAIRERGCFPTKKAAAEWISIHKAMWAFNNGRIDAAKYERRLLRHGVSEDEIDELLPDLLMLKEVSSGR